MFCYTGTLFTDIIYPCYIDILITHVDVFTHRVIPVIQVTCTLNNLDNRNNLILTTYTGTGEIDGGDSVRILGGPRI